MEVAIQALDSFRRARMIDGLTSDDDKLTPLYRIEEFCDLLQSSPNETVKEMVDYLMKRLDHKSPYVKFKVLRVTKNAILKGGKDFKREIQKHSSAMRGLFHYRAPPDALKGDAPSKAVREMAQDAVQTLFSSDDSRPSNSETGRRKMEGFGSTDLHPSSNKRTNGLGSDGAFGKGNATSFSNIIEMGSTSIKQGLHLIRDMTQSSGALGSSGRSFPGLNKSLNSDISSDNYQSPNLDNGHYTRHDGYESYSSSKGNDYTHSGNYRNDFDSGHESSRFSNAGNNFKDASFQDEALQEGASLTDEAKLVEGITMQGGVRLQPTRESLQSFVSSVMKLNSQRIAQALEKKLESPSWQVRVKAMCALESVLRQVGDPVCDEIAYAFENDPSSIVSCYESPQASLRDKSKRVLDLLKTTETTVETPSVSKPEPEILPDLIDALDEPEPDLVSQNNPSSVLLSPPTVSSSTVNDLLGDDLFSLAPQTVDQEKTFELFDSLSIHQPSVPSVNGSNHTQVAGNDLFDGLNLNNEPTSIQTSPKPSSQPSNSIEDLMFSTAPSTSFSLSSNATNIQSQSQPQPQTSPKPNIQPMNNLSSDVFNSLSALSQPSPPNPAPSYTPSVPYAQYPYSQFAALTPQQQVMINQQMIQQQILYIQAMGANFNPGHNPLASFPPSTTSPHVGGAQGAFVPGSFGLSNPGNPMLTFPGRSQTTNSHPVDFDFSGDPSIRTSPSSDSKKDNETRAFDFVTEQMQSAKSKSSLRH